MKKLLFFSSALCTCLCSGFTISCSQPVTQTNQSVFGVYHATTPYDETVGKILGLSPDIKCDMIKWKLTLFNNPKITEPAAFNLICTYGLSRQGSRGFQEGAKQIELKGKCTIGKGFNRYDKTIVYNLVADSLTVSLSFYKPDQNLLHLLAKDKNLMVGNGAWAYTLTRVEPLSATAKNIFPKPVSSPRLVSDSLIVGIFEGRSPCDNEIKKLHNITSNNCNLVKYQLTLYQDTVTHTPAGFRLNTVYVGFGDNNVYIVTGKWKLLQGTVADPEAMVYRLEPENSPMQLLLQKADENILFFLDNDTRLLTGNDYCSYTLNRKK